MPNAIRLAAYTTMIAAFATAAQADFSQIDTAVARAIAAKEVPGAVVLVGRKDEVVFEKAYGNRSVQPTTQPMKLDTIFDLASLSKCIGTMTSVLILADRGQIDLDAPVAKYLPAFGANGKQDITVAMLMLHRGGLIPDTHLREYVGTREEMVDRFMAVKPTTQPGSKTVYSDVGFQVLGELVSTVSGKPFDQFVRDEVFLPLGMTDSAYNPPAAWRDRIAPTEKRKGEWILGEVHDPRAYAMGGVAGHAGVFGTARDVSRWVRMLNNGGVLDGKRILSEAIVKRAVTGIPMPDGKDARALGVDVDTSFSGSPRGRRFEVGTTFGHTGYTGTSFWSDPSTGVYYVLLTNRVHPSDAAGKVAQLRREVATIAAETLLGPAPTTKPAE